VRYYFLLILLIFTSFQSTASGYNVVSIGFFDFELDKDLQGNNLTGDLRFEQRYDNILFEIGPEEDNFFFLKPFYGIELTGDSAVYLNSGFYIDDNLGELFTGKKNNFNFTPSFGAGYFDNGSGKNLGNWLQFKTTLEISYLLKNNNRIGLSFAHISNANIGDKNPGVEILSFSYQKPF
jgi:lipid A 3-O-deacylase